MYRPQTLRRRKIEAENNFESFPLYIITGILTVGVKYYFDDFFGSRAVEIATENRDFSYLSLIRQVDKRSE